MGQEIVQAGYFGSYARGDWGVSSDLDLILIVKHADRPFWRRPLDWSVLDLPLPVDLLVYTQDEWAAMLEQETRFSHMLKEETIWVYPPE